MTDIKSRVIDCIKTAEIEDGVEIRDDSHLINDLKLDSLDMVEIAMAIETAFSIEIDDSRLNGFQTVGDVVLYVTDAIAEIEG